MPTHVTISMKDGVASSAATIADPTLTAADNITISFGDDIGVIRTGPINSAVYHARRAVLAGLTPPVTVPLFGVESNATTLADANLVDAGAVAVTLGASVLPKSTTVQFKERAENAVNAYTEGLV
jgi:hypothetical protein